MLELARHPWQGQQTITKLKKIYVMFMHLYINELNVSSGYESPIYLFK